MLPYDLYNHIVMFLICEKDPLIAVALVRNMKCVNRTFFELVQNRYMHLPSEIDLYYWCANMNHLKNMTIHYHTNQQIVHIVSRLDNPVFVTTWAQMLQPMVLPFAKMIRYYQTLGKKKKLYTWLNMKRNFFEHVKTLRR